MASMKNEARLQPIASAHETVAALVTRSNRDAIPVRREFVQRKSGDGTSLPGPLAAFVRANDRFGLLLYLLLLTCASQKPYDVSHHSSVWARALGLPEFNGATARTRVSKAWHRLIERQLVTRERTRRSASLTPLKEDGSGDDYERPSSRFINIRHGLWTSGPLESEGPRWYDVLTLAELAVLLIALMNADDFALPAERVPDFYGVSADTFERGVRALQNHGLLDVSRSRKAAPLAPEGYTIENRHTLRPPFGPMGTMSVATGAVR